MGIFKSNFIKIFLLTFLLFIFLDIVLGNFIYKKFIRTSFVDQDISFGKKDDIFDHGFVKSYKTQNAGWGEIRYNFCTDPNAFRSDCKNQFLKNKNFDLAFIGDSFTEGVGINFEETFVGIIASDLKNKKIANLAASSYSPAIYFSKINYLLQNGYSFNEIIVFLDLSDIQDDAVCYKLENSVVKRRGSNYSCFKNNKDLFDKLEKRLRLSSEFLRLLNEQLIEFKIIDYSPPGSVVDNPRARWTYDFRRKDFNNLSLDDAVKISIENMSLLSVLLKENNIDLSLAVYPWPGTLKNDNKNNKQLNIWKNFCVSNCKNFYNLMEPFFTLSRKESFVSVYKKMYINDDIHFNEEGNKILAKKFLKLYKSK